MSARIAPAVQMTAAFEPAISRTNMPLTEAVSFSCSNTPPAGPPALARSMSHGPLRTESGRLKPAVRGRRDRNEKLTASPAGGTGLGALLRVPRVAAAGLLRPGLPLGERLAARGRLDLGVVAEVAAR